MGIFDKLFGGKKQKLNNPSTDQELRLEYNVMKNISLEKCKKYKDPSEYRLIEDGIYADLKDGSEQKYRMTISYELESNETNNQYPLEDILDKYLLHVSDFLESEKNTNQNSYKLELGGFLDGMKNAKEIIGKKVYNREFKDEDGQTRVDLIIE